MIILKIFLRLIWKWLKRQAEACADEWFADLFDLSFS
jgi:hypothetical protein